MENKAQKPVRTMTTLVLGIGNTLLCDEGAGIHVLDLLRRDAAKPAVAYVDGGTLSFTLAPLIEDADALIVLDAARMDSTPGTLRVLVGKEMDRFVGSGKKTPHEVSLSDLLAIARLQGRLPARRALVGIEPRRVDWGTQPSEDVAACIPAAAAAVVSLLEAWGV